VPSHLYSYSFEMKPDWTKTYANQPEILAYFEHCADKYDLRRHLQTDTALCRRLGCGRVSLATAQRRW